MSCGRVLEPYAFENKFAAFGFGGLPYYLCAKETLHCFNLNGSEDPTVVGLEGLFSVYKIAVKGTGFSGPTYFL